MKIGIDAHTLGSKSSGNENYYLQLLQELASTQPNGNRYTIYFTYPHALPKIPFAAQFELRRIRPLSPYLGIPASFPIGFHRDTLDAFHAQSIVQPLCHRSSGTTTPY